ncbi:MAG: FkbM family methyltransferase [Tunicatimonas sp.]
MQPKNKLTRYYNLIKRFSNWQAYLLFKVGKKAKIFTFRLRENAQNGSIQSDLFQIEVPRSMLPAFKESFFDDIYFRQLPPYTIDKSNPVVVDIGANVGFFSLYMFSRFPRARVFAFEPMPYNYRQLQHYRETYPQFELHAINQAVSDTTEPLALHTTKTDGYTTMASVFTDPRNQETLSVEATTLPTVVEHYELPQIDFLKLDCEGSEYAILYGLPTEQLRKIRAMCVETHRGQQASENTLALCDYLRENEFALTYLDQGKSGYIWAWQW